MGLLQDRQFSICMYTLFHAEMVTLLNLKVELEVLFQIDKLTELDCNKSGKNK